MRGLIGGVLAGGFVSVIGLGTVSLVSEQPAGVMPPAAPQTNVPSVDAPQVDQAQDADADQETSGQDAQRAPQAATTSPVGSVTILEPQAPDLPESESGALEPQAPQASASETMAPQADTDPLAAPGVTSVEGAMEAPDAPQSAQFAADPVEPVLPNPQSQAPQTPDTEADLTIQTTPDQPVMVIDTEVEVVDTTDTTETFVVDLGAGDAPEPAPVPAPQTETAPPSDLTPQGEDSANADAADPDTAQDTPRLQMQGGENTLLADRDTGVTIRRPASQAEAEATEAAAPGINALRDFAASSGDVADTPVMSVILIDDGSMSAAAAALAGLPFSVTIGIDPSMEGAANLMERYRSDGFEVVALAKVPEGAAPSDVEIAFQSVFATLPESIAVLDTGNGGLQSDREVTRQAMDILASQGRGFITAGQGLNMAGRAANAAGVPAVALYRDLDSDGQDARIVRRFIDQAAFRARQGSGVVLVGRVRPDTISALILWGTANQDDQIAVVPVSAVLLAQDG